MGVICLNNFVNKIDGLRNTYELKISGLVIDGNNFVYHLFRCHTILKYGGDYNEYTIIVCNYFQTLKQCNINPVIIFDGTFYIDLLANRHQHM